VSSAGLSVCLSFDFDAMSVWLAGSSDPATISRGEFGAVAIARILALLDRHAARATFFVPGHTALAYPFLVREIRDAGHEIGHHGWVHEDPAALSPQQERDVFARGLEALERAAGAVPVGYRSPGASLSSATVEILLENGMLYDSSCSGSDFTPYYLRRGDVASKTEPYRFGAASDLVEMPFSWILDDFPHFEFEVGWSTEQGPPSAVREIWEGEFRYAARNAPDGVFGLCMHPQVIGRGHRLDMLDGLLGRMAEARAVFEPLADFAARWRDTHPVGEWQAGEDVHARAAREALQ
jgi:peptidoglycan/xylan/chitin deacetylase (PgdA/CDA1 family)